MKYCNSCTNKFEDSVSFCPNCGEVLEDDPTSLVGATLDGQYHIDALLGKGGMGAVYKAKHIMLGDQVAIKVLPREMRSNAEWLRRFRREGQAARRFRHPNSVTVYDLRTTQDGMVYMVMEYVEGHTLDQELKKKGRFTPKDAFLTLEPVMSVLAAAHAVGVVHRDLKPENIMIGKLGDSGAHTTKLLDLGIAKMRELAGSSTNAGTALTVAGQILGTPFYMSPEQWGEMARDGNPEIDGRADIYSLGTVFYELVSGRRPFEANTLQEIRRVHVFVAPPALSDTVPGVNVEFSNAVARAMAKDRDDRPATMDEFAAELSSALGLKTQASGSEARPIPDRSQGEPSNNAATITANDVKWPARETNADISAPTVITAEPLNSSVAANEETLQHPPPSPVMMPTQPSLNEQMPALRHTPDVPASNGSESRAVSPVVSRPQPQSGQIGSAGVQESVRPVVPVSDDRVQAKPKKGSALLLVGIIAVLGVVVLGGGGLWYFLKGKDTGGTTVTNAPPVKPGTNNGATAGTAAKPEIVRYWLDPVSVKGGAPARLIDNFTLQSGDKFRFHFVPQMDGYLYIYGSDSGKLRTFLSNKANAAATGVASNRVQKGTDLVYPKENEIALDNRTGTEVYTVIFSPVELTQPFANASVGDILKPQDDSALRSFMNEWSANGLEKSVSKEGPGYACISRAESQDPAVFKIELDHR